MTAANRRPAERSGSAARCAALRTLATSNQAGAIKTPCRLTDYPARRRRAPSKWDSRGPCHLDYDAAGGSDRGSQPPCDGGSGASG
ncbi:MAG: hypothetical protein ACRD2W_01445, partial [Acidimicrobiales bacterium]